MDDPRAPVTEWHDFDGIDDLPRHLRTCAAMQPEVQVILPAKVALQLARRIEAGRAVPPEPVAFSWVDWSAQLIGSSMTVFATLIWAVVILSAVSWWVVP